MIDFKRYGIGCLVLSVGFGIVASWDVIKCSAIGFRDLDLGKLSDTSKKVKPDDPKPTYGGAAKQGTGFMTDMVDVVPVCAKEGDFKAPLLSWYGMLGAGGLGLLLLILNFVIKPNWQKGVRNYAKTPQEDDVEDVRRRKPPTAPKESPEDRFIDPGPELRNGFGKRRPDDDEFS